MTQESHLTCTECGRTFETESLTIVDGELRCPDCLSAATVVCRAVLGATPTERDAVAVKILFKQ